MVLGKNLRVRKKAVPLSVVLEYRTLGEALLFQYTSILSLREFREPKVCSPTAVASHPRRLEKRLLSLTYSVPEEVEALCKNHEEVTKAYGCLGVLCVNQGATRTLV